MVPSEIGNLQIHPHLVHPTFNVGRPVSDVHNPHMSAPEADPRFNEFVILQAQNAGLFLGQLPNPHTGEKEINLRAAKSVLDSLEMLEQKTQGNLTATEYHLLKMALNNLRPLYEDAEDQ
jgi:hypothetical protein